VPSTIRIKRSSVAGKRPTTSDISTGELAINTKDFKLFSSNGTAVFELGNAGALANTNARIGLLNTNLTGTNTALRTLIATKANDVGAANRIPYRNSSNVLTSSSGLQYDGVSIKVNGNLESTYQNGDEGGEFFLAKSVTNTTLVNGVTIDVFRNQLRFFENGGTNRGYYIDISGGGTSAGTNLVGGGGGGGGGTVTLVKTTVKDLTQNDLVVTNATLAGISSIVDNAIVQQTNTALRTLISDRLQVANAAAVYQTKAVERAALANTNSSVATQTARITLVNTNLTGTNTALRTLINARLQVANAATLYTTKVNPTTSGLLAHTGRATISTNLTVSGNTQMGGVSKVTDVIGLLTVNGRASVQTNFQVNGNTIAGGTFNSYGATTLGLSTTNPTTITGRASVGTNLSVAGNTSITNNLTVNGVTTLGGTLVANGSSGTSGHYLRSSGTGLYWSPISSGANGFSGILVGSNVVVADSTTDRLTLVAGSNITLAANPATDTITISSTASGGYDYGINYAFRSISF